MSAILPVAVRRPAALVSVLLLAGLLLSVLFAVPAEAHVRLDLVKPQDGSRLDAAPDTLVFVATEPLEAGSVQVEVRGQRTGTDVKLGEGYSGARVGEFVVPVVGPMPHDAYFVDAQVTGLDGHTVGSTWAIVIGPGPAISATGGVTGAGADPTTVVVLETARVVAIVVTPLLALPLVLVLVHPAGFALARVRRAFVAGMMLGFGAAALELFGTASALTGPSGSWVDGLLLAWALPSGKLLVVRCVALLALAFAFVVLRRDAAGNRWSPTHANVAITSAAVVVIANAAGSHAAEDETGMVALVMSATHLAAVSLWLAGVVLWWCCSSPEKTRAPVRTTPALAAAGTEADRGTGAEPVIRPHDAPGGLPLLGLARFALMARCCVALAVATGLFLAWRFTDGFDMAALSGRYGALLTVKLVVVALLVVAALGSHQLTAAGREAGRSSSPSVVRRALRFELAVGAIVMTLGGLLAEIG